MSVPPYAGGQPPGERLASAPDEFD